MTALGNVSTAVRQRRVEAHDSLDDFPTPPWAARALLEALNGHGETDWRGRSVWEPAANRGAMVRGLTGAVRSLRASDVHDYGAGFPVADFLFPDPVGPVDWVITNPPFRLAEAFARRGLDVATCGVALLVRLAFLEGAARYTGLFADTPPTRVLQFCERVVMHKGRLPDPDVAEPHEIEKDGELVTVMRKPSTATAYAWLIWERFPNRAARTDLSDGQQAGRLSHGRRQRPVLRPRAGRCLRRDLRGGAGPGECARARAVRGFGAHRLD